MVPFALRGCDVLLLHCIGIPGFPKALVNVEYSWPSDCLYWVINPENVLTWYSEFNLSILHLCVKCYCDKAGLYPQWDREWKEIPAGSWSEYDLSCWWHKQEDNPGVLLFFPVPWSACIPALFLTLLLQYWQLKRLLHITASLGNCNTIKILEDCLSGLCSMFKLFEKHKFLM